MEDLAGTGASYPTTDLRGARTAGMTCLAAFKALGLPGQAATRAAIAADLQRGLWVMSAETIYGQSCTIVSLKVLDRDAAALKGHRYRSTGTVFDLEFSSAQDYWGISPPGLHTRTNLFIGVVDRGYGPWKDDIGVVFDQRVTQLHNEHTVTIWGTCAGFCTFKSNAGKRVTLPLIHAKYVTVH